MVRRLPERFVPLALLPTWNVEAMCAEIRRVAAKGLPRGHHAGDPAPGGPAELPRHRLLGPVFQTLSDTGLVMCLHIGSGFGAISMAKDAHRQPDCAGHPDLGNRRAGSAVGPAMRAYPDLKFAFSEGGIGWIPFYLDRCDRHYPTSGGCVATSAANSPARCSASIHWPAMSPTRRRCCCATRSGIDIIAWECDYPHSDCFWPNAAELMLDELNRAGASDSDIDKIGWENSARFFNWDPLKDRTREDLGRSTAPRRRRRRRVSIRSRAEWARRYRDKQAASAT